MTYKDIKYIDESWIDKKLKEYEINHTTIDRQSPSLFVNIGKIEMLKDIKQHLTSATPILEKAFKAGEMFNMIKNHAQSCMWDKVNFEQFLNTEVNI